jgi:Tfp pilus assembly protein FimT
LRRGCGGWSLPELVMVIVIVAALSYTAIQVFRPREVQSINLAERFRDDVRHAQMLAVNWGRPLRLTVAATTYSVSCVTAGAAPCDFSPVFDPNTGQAFSFSLVSPPSGTLQEGFTLAGPATVDFDALGRPRTGAGALITANSDYTISGGAVARVVRVAPITGFASLQ